MSVAWGQGLGYPSGAVVNRWFAQLCWPCGKGLNRDRRVASGVALLTISGEHDLYTAPALREHLDGALATGDLIVDLSAATFVDSSVLGALLNARQRAMRNNGALRSV